MTDPNLDNVCSYHPPSSSTIPKYEAVRAAQRTFMETLVDLCPDSRERSLALTNAEQAAFWANAAIARNPQD